MRPVRGKKPPSSVPHPRLLSAQVVLGAELPPKTAPGPDGRGPHRVLGNGPFPCCCEGANTAAGGALTLATGVFARPTPAPREERAAVAWGAGPEPAWEREWGPARLAHVQPPPGEGPGWGLLDCLRSGRQLSHLPEQSTENCGPLDAVTDAVSRMQGRGCFFKEEN